MAVRLVMEVLRLFSRSACNIIRFSPGLAEITVQGWMDTLEYPDLVPVIPRNFEDQSGSQPKYLVETAYITNVVKSVTMRKHGKEGI